MSSEYRDAFGVLMLRAIEFHLWELRQALAGADQGPRYEPGVFAGIEQLRGYMKGLGLDTWAEGSGP